MKALGKHIKLPRSPRSFFTRSIINSPMKFPAFVRNVAFVSWPDCVRMSESSHFRPPDKSLPGYLDPDPGVSQKLALDCKRWSCASENFLLSKCETEVTDRKKFLGRGSRDFLSPQTSLSSVSLLERNISLIRNAVSGPGCFRD